MRIKVVILIKNLFTKNVCNTYETIFPYLIDLEKLDFKYKMSTFSN